MFAPNLTPSNELAIKMLTRFSEENLDPMPWFARFAGNLNSSLEDDPQFSKPLYPDFPDYNHMHDTSRLKHVYLNDFDFNLEEDRERLARITRMEFEENSFETVAKCQYGCTKGNYLLNSGRVCKKCGTPVEIFLNEGEDTRVWLRCPEGVEKFINIGFFTTFFNNILIANPSPSISVPRFFVDPIYRAEQKKKRNGSNIALNQLLQDLKITQINLNTFYQNCDAIMEYILVGKGSRYSKLKKDGPEALAMYHKFKEIAFCDYIKVPARYCVVLEKTGKEVLSYKHHPETAKLYHAIADTAKSNALVKMSAKDLLKNIDIVGKNLVALSDQYRETNNPKGIFNKPGINRKHVCAGPVPVTGRSVITSQTGIINADEIMIPWKLMNQMYETPILSYLYRKGYTPVKAKLLHRRASYEIVPEIDEFFRYAEENRQMIMLAGRNPSIEYLSRKAFFPRVNRDLTDESVKIPITGTREFNADFDGDQMYLIGLIDNESKAKAYGAWGHHQVLDRNVPFKVSRYAGQTVTTQMNLNTMLMQTPLMTSLPEGQHFEQR